MLVLYVSLPCTIRSVLAPFAPLFSARVFRHAILLVTGTLLVPGRRTVTFIASIGANLRSWRRELAAAWVPREV
jgi:hypothetical protein